MKHEAVIMMYASLKHASLKHHEWSPFSIIFQNRILFPFSESQKGIELNSSTHKKPKNKLEMCFYQFHCRFL